MREEGHACGTLNSNAEFATSSRGAAKGSSPYCSWERMLVRCLVGERATQRGARNFKSKLHPFGSPAILDTISLMLQLDVSAVASPACFFGQSWRLREWAADLLNSFSPWPIFRVSSIANVKRMVPVDKPKVCSLTCRKSPDLTPYRKATSRYRERGISSSTKKRTHLTSPRVCRRQKLSTETSNHRRGMYTSRAYRSQLTYQIATLPTSATESQAPLRGRKPHRQPTG